MFEIGMDFIVKLFAINANTYFNNRKKSVIYFKGSRLKRFSVSKGSTLTTIAGLRGYPETNMKLGLKIIPPLPVPVGSPP